MNPTSKITVAELVSLEAGKGINFTGMFPPTFNGTPFGAGAPGANGLNNATVLLFNSSTSSTPPILPLDPVIYTFATGAAVGATGGWSTAYPNNTDPYKWVTKYVAISADPTYTIQPSDWSAASIMAKDGSSGYNTARLYIYQRLPEGQTPASPNATTTYTFSTNELTGLTNGWMYLIPLGSDPLWVSSATATSYSSSDTITPAEWSSPVILVKNGSNGSKGDTGTPGIPGDKSITLDLYTWSTTQPSAPTGTTTYTWATGVHSGNVGVWYPTVQTNSGVPGLKLWSVTKTITVPYDATSSSISWSGNAVSQISQNGAGFRTVEASVFKWSLTLPSAPIGTGTYDWTGSAVVSDPASSPGWHIVANNADMSPGFTLWKASVFVQDSLLVNQTSFNWSGASIVAVGYAGTQGPSGSTDLGAQGASARIAYKKYSSGTSPSNSPDPYTIAGDTLPPANTWDSTGVSWSTTVPTLGANEFLYQANGVFNPATNQTAWSAPYQTSFKVGNLSALSANMGTITSGNITLDTSGFIRTAGASYGSGSGIWMGYTGGTYKISIGGLTYDGTTLSVPAASITGQLSAGQINTNGLTIRDASGNVILGAGASVNPSSYMNVPAGWQNSNLTLSSNGTLASSGTTLGTVTATGLGAVKTDLSNAPTGIRNDSISLTQSGNTYSLANAGSSSTISIGGLGYTGALNATADISLIASGNNSVSGNIVTKVSGTGDWNGYAISKDSYVGGAFVSAIPSANYMSYAIGLVSNSSPSSVPAYGYMEMGLVLLGDGIIYYTENAGVYNSNALVSTGYSYSAGDVVAVVYDGVTVKYLKNGTVIRSASVINTNNLFMLAAVYHVTQSLKNIRFGPMSNNSWASVGGSGKPQDNATVGATLGVNVVDNGGNVVSTDAVKNNLIDLSWWKPNAALPWTNVGESVVMGSAINWGVNDPKGGADTIMFAKELTGDGAGGGGWYSPTIPLDINKTYRFIVPVRALFSTGNIYWGTINVCNLNTTTVNSNPYFASISKSVMNTDRWYLMVGYIFPYNSIGFTHAGAGIIDCQTGLFVDSGLNFNFNSLSGVNHRAFQDSAPLNATCLLGRPVINLVDGSEPPLTSFFTSSALLNKAITVSNSSNSYTINGIGSTGSITISGLGYSGDLNATRGAPVGTTVGGSDAGVVATATNNYNNQVQVIDMSGGNQTTFYPVLISSSISGAAYYDFTVFRNLVHENGTSLGSYSCQIIARSYNWGNAPGAIIEINQATGSGTYYYGVSRVIANNASNGIIVYLRGGMTHRISMSQPIGAYTVSIYLTQYIDGVVGTIYPETTGPLLNYLNRSYCPDSPVEWSSSISGSGKPQDNATVGAPAGTPVAGNFPGGTAAGTVESNASTALTNANNALNNRLAKSGADILTGPITLNAANAILVGTPNDGLYLGNTGIVGRKSGVTTFAVDQAGNATFAGTLAANIVSTNNLVIGSVNASSTSVISGVTFAGLAAANSYRNGTLTGPVLTLTGRPVRGGFSGNITIFTNDNTSLINYQLSYSLLLVKVSNSSYVVNLSSSDNVLMKRPSGNNYFEINYSCEGIMASSTTAEQYRLDLIVSVYATNPDTGAAMSVITRLDGYGIFSLNELKV